MTQIRTATAAEREALSELHRRSSYVWEGDRADLDAHPDALGVAAEAIAAGRVRVAVGTGGELIGFWVVADGPDGVCELDDLFVEPRLMRQGIGRALVEDAAARGSRRQRSDDRRRPPAQLRVLRERRIRPRRAGRDPLRAGREAAAPARPRGRVVGLMRFFVAA